jgi:hypothetical protein
MGSWAQTAVAVALLQLNCELSWQVWIKIGWTNCLAVRLDSQPPPMKVSGGAQNFCSGRLVASDSQLPSLGRQFGVAGFRGWWHLQQNTGFQTTRGQALNSRWMFETSLSGRALAAPGLRIHRRFSLQHLKTRVSFRPGCRGSISNRRRRPGWKKQTMENSARAGWKLATKQPLDGAASGCHRCYWAWIHCQSCCFQGWFSSSLSTRRMNML